MITKAEIQAMMDDCGARIEALDKESHPFEALALIGESMALLKIYITICQKEKK